MALTKCKECNNEISDKADSCPKCGAKIVRTSGFTKLIAWLIGGGFIFSILIGSIQSNRQQEDVKQEQARMAALTSEQRAKETAKKQAEAAAEATNKQHSDARFAKTLSILSGIKKVLLDPESARWTEVIADETGNTVCVSVVAKNGFGGLTEESYSFYGEKASKSSASWSKHCTGKGFFDMKYALRALP